MNWAFVRYLHVKMVVLLFLMSVSGLAAAIATGFIVCLTGISLLLLVPNPSQLLRAPIIAVSVGGAASGVIGLVLWSERNATEHAIATVNARPMEDEYPQTRALVQSLAQQADVPMPSLHVAQTQTPLSMTTGFRPSSAQVIVSEALLNSLPDEELEAVFAHELAHIKNRDVAVMTVTALPFGAAQRVLELLFGPTTGAKHGEPSRASYADQLVALGLFLVFPVWILTHLLTASFSRTREFTADRGAVAITGNPAALATALERIDMALADRPSSDLRSTEIAAFAIIESPSSTPQGLLAPVRSLLRRTFATHPPTAERIERIQALRTQCD